jgi:hypothetical protein
MRKIIDNHHPLRQALGALLVLLLLAACRDDLRYGVDTGPEEGKPATVSLRVAIDDMTVSESTRAFIDEDAANFCQDIWIGIYRVRDGKRLFSRLLEDPAQINELVNTKYGVGRFDVPVESGRAYIVGIANSTTRYGIANSHSDPIADRVTLSTLLLNADSWDKFRNISVLRSDTTDINIFSPDLIMSGYYSEDEANFKSTEDSDLPYYDIDPGTNSMTGAIYLRRLINYSKFNVYAGPNINLELTSWRVCNNPACCYLLEQTDVSADSLNWYGTSDDIHAFTSESDGALSFEAYLLANKETAVPYQEIGGDYVGIRPNVSQAEMYADRERQFKDASGRNTGIFRSLVTDPTDKSLASMHGNTATYIELTGRVTYYIADTPDNRNNPENGSPEPYDASKAQILREGKVKYTVHLGYCYYKDEQGNPTYETARDFNIRRNTRYTYNITINGLNKIIVEALEGREVQPGAEGYVTDAYDSNIQLDAHYGVFNISLSNAERNDMGYHITAPFGSQTLDFTSANYESRWENLETYSWIKFMPTTDSLTLAKYPGTTSSKLLSLHDMADPAGHPHSAGATDVTDRTQRWYTVFVDEYVYHQDADGNSLSGTDAETNWRNYVNLDNRVCELRVQAHTNSGDGNSVYTSSKYVVSQRSIQTYYREIEGGENTGVGIEYTNESYGLNMYMLYNSYNSYNINNGRMNELMVALHGTYGQSAWNRAVVETQMQTIPADSTSSTGIYHPAATYPVPALFVWSTASGRKRAYSPSPQDLHFYLTDLACMNRNRDLNGDGKITADEVKWYLPSYWGYVRLVAGQMDLISPLMDWDKYPTTLFNGKKDLNGRQLFHYATSDARYLWAEEGMSVGDGIYTTDIGYPYEIRCVRNLGTSMPNYTFDTTSPSEIVSPFTVVGYTIYMSYYRASCLRSATGSYLPQHAINNYANRPADAFIISQDYCKSLPGQYGQLYVDDDGYVCPQPTVASSTEQNWVDLWSASLVRNTICREYSEKDDKSDQGDWRVPNQLELTFMQMAGFIEAGNNVVCATHEYFETYPTSDNKYKYFGISKDIMTRSIFDNIASGYKIKVRCVKDVF